MNDEQSNPERIARLQKIYKIHADRCGEYPPKSDVLHSFLALGVLKRRLMEATSINDMTALDSDIGKYASDSTWMPNDSQFASDLEKFRSDLKNYGHL